jgi:hypothetical protein
VRATTCTGPLSLRTDLLCLPSKRVARHSILHQVWWAVDRVQLFVPSTLDPNTHRSVLKRHSTITHAFTSSKQNRMHLPEKHSGANLRDLEPSSDGLPLLQVVIRKRDRKGLAPMHRLHSCSAVCSTDMGESLHHHHHRIQRLLHNRTSYSPFAAAAMRNFFSGLRRSVLISSETARCRSNSANLPSSLYPALEYPPEHADTVQHTRETCNGQVQSTIESSELRPICQVTAWSPQCPHYTCRFLVIHSLSILTET